MSMDTMQHRAKELAAKITDQGGDPLAVLAAIRDTLEDIADDLKKREPYATRSIQRYRDAGEIIAALWDATPAEADDYPEDGQHWNDAQ